MVKTTDKPKLKTRQVGEKVTLALGLDAASTKDLGDGTIEAVITTAAVDRTNENIETTGIDTSTFMATGGPVLYGHDYEGLPIGKTIKLTEMKNKIKARFQLAVEEYPFANTVYAMIKGGYLNAVSIGGIVREWSEDYRTIAKMEMVEFSVVPVPANAQALITSRSLEQVTGKSIDTIKAEYKDFAREVLLDKVSDMGEDEVSKAISVLEKLLATLKVSAQASAIARATEPKAVSRIKYVTLRETAAAVNNQSQRIIKTIKLSTKE